MKRFSLGLIALVAVATLAACDRATTAPAAAPAPTFTGWYRLANIDGQPLPVTLKPFGDSNVVRYDSGKVLIREDSSYHYQLWYRYNATPSVEDFAGLVTHTGSGVLFSLTVTGQPYTFPAAWIDGDLVQVFDAGATLVWQPVGP